MNDTLDALRSLSPTLPADSSGLEAAFVRLVLAVEAEDAYEAEDASVVAPDHAPVVAATDALAVRSTRRRRFAGLALAASGVTGVLLVTQLMTPAPALAWSPMGTLVTGARGEQLAAECAQNWIADDPSLAELGAQYGVQAPTAADLGAPRLLLAEERGNTSLVVAEIGGWTAYCAFGQAGGGSALAPGAGADFGLNGNADVETAFISGSGVLLGDEIPERPEDYLYAMHGNVMGVTAPGVVSVTLRTADGAEIEASVGNERFLAWWPGPETRGTELGDVIGPEWDPREGVTVTWTYADGSTGGPADL